MSKAEVILDLVFDETKKYRVEAKVYSVENSKLYPDGVKAKFVLIDVAQNVPRLLVDNHSPFGFHIHTRLPHDKETRVMLNVKSYEEAFKEFKIIARRIINEEI